MAAVTDYFETVEQWRTFHPPEVLTGSSLEADNRQFPAFCRPSDVAWDGIGHSLDHLDYIRRTYQEAHASLAQLSVLRSGLMGITRSLWALKPKKRSDRQEHTLRLALEDIRQAKNARGVLRQLASSTQNQAFDEQVSRMETQIADTATNLGFDNLESAYRTRPEMTSMLRDVTNLVIIDKRDQGAQDVLRAGIDFMWRNHSGVSHGVTTARLGHIDPSTKRQYPDGSVWGRLQPSEQEIASSFNTLVLFTSTAIESYVSRAKP